jgi:hypothetical protein
MTLDELAASMLVVGPSGARASASWDGPWRRTLVANLSILVRQLWTVGLTEVFIDGSVVEDKDHPNDIDGYFVCEERRVRTRSLHRELNSLDEANCWTWDPESRRPFRGHPKRQLPMWHSYRVELYPHWPGLGAGFDAHGHALEFPSFFRQCRANGRPKGIVQVVGESGASRPVVPVEVSQ